MEFAPVTPIHRKSCSIGFHCATELRKNHRPLSAFQDFNGGAIRWWTGEDSNLRSPQGAADLQSAGFSHSPTRPVKTFWDANYESRTCSSTTCGHPAQKHKKDSCQETPARSFFLSGFAPPSLPCKISWWSWRRELNPRPSDFKSYALPAELRQRRSNRLRIAEEVSEL